LGRVTEGVREKWEAYREGTSGEQESAKVQTEKQQEESRQERVR